jgi:hypothetical protein
VVSAGVGVGAFGTTFGWKVNGYWFGGSDFAIISFGVVAAVVSNHSSSDVPAYGGFAPGFGGSFGSGTIL